MHNLTFPLLGAISSIEITEDSEPEKKLNELRDIFNTKLMPELRKAPYVAKSRLAQSVGRSIEDARTLCNFPQLLGKPLVGIVIADSSSANILHNLSDDNGIWKSAISLPCLVTHAGDKAGVEAISSTGKPINFGSMPDHPAGSPCELTAEELKALEDLPKDGINPRSICPALHCRIPLKRADLAFLILPQEEFHQRESSRLLSQCNAMIVAGRMEDGKSLQILRDQFNMPVYFLTSSNVDNEIKYLRSRYAGRQVECQSPDSFNKILDSLSRPVERMTLKDRLLAEFLDVEEDIANRISRRKELMDSLKRDSTLFVNGDGELDDMLESTRKSLREDIQALDDRKNSFATVAGNVLEAAKIFEKNLHDSQPASRVDRRARLWTGVMRPGSIWRRIILRSLVSGNTSQAMEYQARFEEVDPEQAFLTGMYIERHQGNTPGWDRLEKLRFLPDSPEALRAKIFFRHELGLSDTDCANIAAILPRPKSPDEKYYWALHQYEIYQGDKNSGIANGLRFEAVIDAFRDAVLAGSHAAADMFAKYCGGEGRHEEAREIADMGYPTGAWIYRLLSLARKDGKEATRYLKIAAALGYPKAMAALAEDIWKKRVTGDNVGFDFPGGALVGLNGDVIRAGIRIYETVKQCGIEGIPNVNERLAYFYFCDRQWRQCRETLGDNPATTEGELCLAVMLKYGHGGNQNKNSAIALIRMAEDGDGPFAGFARYIKAKWYADDMARI